MKKGKGQDKTNGKSNPKDPRNQIRFSSNPKDQLQRPSLVENSPHTEMIPILTSEQIQKLEALKKESINPQIQEENPRASLRPSMRMSLRQSVRGSKYGSSAKTKLKKKEGGEDETDTKKTDETNITSKTTTRREKAIHQKEEGGDNCCDIFKGQQKKEENPFRKARESYLKN